MASELTVPLDRVSSPAGTGADTQVLPGRPGYVDGKRSPHVGESLPPDPRTPRINEEQLRAVTEAINEQFRSVGRRLKFSVDDASGRTVVKLMDAETDEVIKQIPAEQALELSMRIEESIENMRPSASLLIETVA